MQALAPSNQIAIARADIDELTADFFAGRSERTIKAYRAGLQSFADYMEADSVEEAAEWLLSLPHGQANKAALRFRNVLKDRGLSNATINQKLSALRSLCALGNRQGFIQWTLSVDSFKVEVLRDVSGPGVDGLKKMIALASSHRRPAKAARDIALLRLLADNALRRSEVVGLDLEHWKGETLQVLRKGYTDRLPVTLAPITQEALEAWVAHRGDKPGPLFLNFDHKDGQSGLTGDGLYNLITTLSAKTGNKKSVHSIRHTSITTAIEIAARERKGLQEVQKFSGHKSLGMVLRYNDAVNDYQGQLSELVSKEI